MPSRSAEQRAEPIGVRLKRLRLERGFSQRDLSSPGVSYAYISRIEAGARTPSVKALRMLARKLSVSVDYLETGHDLRDIDARELKLADAELELRLANDTTEVEQKLDAILDEAVGAGDVGAAVRARIALGLAAAHRGAHLEAVERLESALAGEIVPSAHMRPDVYATLAQSYSALGAPERGVALLERCLEQITRDAPDDNAAQIRFATYLSYALTDAGDYERAAAVVREALARADEHTDPYTRVRLYWSLARLSGVEGRSSEALEYIRHAIALLKATDDNVTLARAHLIAAGVESTEGQAAEARANLVLAKRLLGAFAEPTDRAMLKIGASRVATLEGDGDAAVAEARKALDILGDFHGGEQGAAVSALADGLALQGDVDTAGDAFRRAVDLLTVHGRRHDAAQACMRWGRMLQEAGRDDEASTVLQRAADLGLKAETGTTRKR